MSLYFHSLSALRLALDEGRLTSEQLTSAFLERSRSLNPELNAWIRLTEERAMEDARSADALRKAGKAGPLTGLPLGIKDIFCTKGVTTTCGSRMLEDFVPPYESTVTDRLGRAGAVMLGKANMDEFAMGSTSESSYFGATRNPWNPACSPGGSSGGSAAMVAAGMAPASIGTDTGGSVRQPAAFCGVTGLKPTYGRVSRWGMIAYGSSLDQAGLLTRTAEDAALLLNTIAGPDPKDSTCHTEAAPDFLAGLGQDLAGCTAGIPVALMGEGLEPGVRAVVEQSIRTLESLGVKVRPVELPSLDLSIAAYYIIAMAEASSNLSRFDGVRYGYRCDAPADLEDLYKRTRSEGFGAEVKRRILTGTWALSHGFYDAYYVKAQKVRRLLRDDFMKAYECCDFLVGPVSPTTALPLGYAKDDPVKMYLQDVCTVAVNLAGLPALSIPGGFAGNMPVGIQLIGKPWDEAGILNVAHVFQQNTDWHLQTPTPMTEEA
jgi:aspartyl-tRNA(Asn)/glutamyl-tRNA(Gln) amidotransferase subunit A